MYWMFCGSILPCVAGDLVVRLDNDPDYHALSVGAEVGRSYEFYYARDITREHPWVCGETALSDITNSIVRWRDSFVGQGRHHDPRIFVRSGLADDSDGDGLGDGFETVVLKTLPDNPDSDGDGTWDGLEDFDGDGLTNSEEYNSPRNPDFDSLRYRTNPWIADTDGDGVDDAQDAFPLDPAGSIDTDADGKPDTVIADSNSSPAITEDDDDDNDRFTDAEEVQMGTDSLDPGDGAALIEETRTTILERWHMVSSEPLEFNNEPGSPEDIQDMAAALNQLSAQFFTGQ